MGLCYSATSMELTLTVQSAEATIGGELLDLGLVSLTCITRLVPGSQSQRTHHAQVNWRQSGGWFQFAARCGGPMNATNEVFDLVVHTTDDDGEEPKKYTLKSFRFLGPDRGSYFGLEHSVA